MFIVITFLLTLKILDFERFTKANLAKTTENRKLK